MTSTYARAELFDASALVKVFADEPYSDVVREYFFRRPTTYTTEFCFYEALNILKSKWKYKRLISEAEYLRSAHDLTVWYTGVKNLFREIELPSSDHLLRVQEVAARTGLDYSDAFQIVSLKYGRFANLVQESQTVLTTADRGLASAARAEGLRVWCVLDEAPPNEV